MESTKTYILVVGKNPDDLVAKVTEKITQGYYPWGGFGVDGGRLMQPMIWRKGLDG